VRRSERVPTRRWLGIGDMRRPMSSRRKGPRRRLASASPQTSWPGSARCHSSEARARRIRVALSLTAICANASANAASSSTASSSFTIRRMKRYALSQTRIGACGAVAPAPVLAGSGLPSSRSASMRAKTRRREVRSASTALATRAMRPSARVGFGSAIGPADSSGNQWSSRRASLAAPSSKPTAS
jgi:hypothetical protein